MSESTSTVSKNRISPVSGPSVRARKAQAWFVLSPPGRRSFHFLWVSGGETSNGRCGFQNTCIFAHCWKFNILCNMGRAKQGEITATCTFPPYCIKWIGEKHFVVGGGGGAAKTGVLNRFVSLCSCSIFTVVCEDCCSGLVMNALLGVISDRI